MFNVGHFGLYRDDGLAVIDWASARALDNIKKKAISTMKEAGFKITIEIGQVRTDFLDVTLDLSDSTHRLFRKPNANISYIHQSSNHDPCEVYTPKHG